MTATGTVCTTCGTEPSRVGARYCDACGSQLAVARSQAEYKQVTVLFADVVHSMDIAAAVGTERLREIMTALLDRSTAVVRHCGGTVDKFTGDGVMVYFDDPPVENQAARAVRMAVRMRERLRTLCGSWRERGHRLRFARATDDRLGGVSREERDRWTVSLGLSQLAGSIEIPTTVLMAGSVIVTIPIIVVFFASERLLTEGLTAGAEKG